MKNHSWIAAGCLVVALLACKKGEENQTAEAPSAQATIPAIVPSATAAPEPAEPEAPKTPESPIPDIPPGRSAPPTLAEWRDAAEVNTQGAGSQPDQCFMKIVREWLKVNCSGKVLGYSGMKDFGTEHSDYFSSVKLGKHADFVVRLRKGKTMELRIQRVEGEAVLFAFWPPAQDKPTMVALGKGKK